MDALLPDDESCRKAFALLPDWRRRKCEALRFAADRRRSVAAWMLLVELLAVRGVDASGLAVEIGATGRPEFVPSVGWRFSLSHAEGRVMAAVSDRPVGCDVERVRPLEPGLPEACLDEVELARFAALAEASERERLFCRLWTRKESLGKALGRGLGDDPRLLAVSGGCPVSGAAFTDLDFGDGHLGCVCTI